MDEKEIQSLIDQLKAQGMDEEKIMDMYYDMFVDGKMDRKDLETLAGYLGYELDDDFKNDEHADPIDEKAEADKVDEEPKEELENISKEEAEDLKAMKPGESKEEFEEKVEDAKEDLEEADKHDEEAKDEKADEDEEWDEANKYFKV